MRPGRRGLWQLAVWVGSGLVAAFWGPFLWVWIGHGGLLAFLFVVDALAITHLPLPRFERKVDKSLSLGVWSPVELTLENPHGMELRLAVFDHPPPGCEIEGLPTRLRLPPRSTGRLTYQLRPGLRGDLGFAPGQVLLASRLGLWERRLRLGAEQEVRVLPNFRPVAHYALLGVDDRLGQMGIRLARRRGAGLEFRELRDWREGDSMRQIDWKATARRRVLISRDYQDERNQQVVLLVDCGRRMRAVDGDLTHFDHALNAVLLLAYAAVHHGDAVGLATFSGEPRWLPPTQGTVAMNAVLGAVYDLPTSAEPPDYLAAARRLVALQRRRALVVVLSNLRDEDASELATALGMLSQRHLVLLASLREKVLSEAVEFAPSNLDEALLTGSVHHYLAARRRAHEALRARGVLTLDVEPDHLAIATVNRYLEIKRTGLL